MFSSEPTVERPVRTGDVPSNFKELNVIGGTWSRSNVTTEYGDDYNRGIYPKLSEIADPALKAQMLALYDKHQDPRVVMSLLNGPYKSDGSSDLWITSFKSGEGDCDRSVAHLRHAEPGSPRAAKLWLRQTSRTPT